MFDFVQFLDPEAFERATVEMRRIYGFESWPGGLDVAERGGIE